MPGPARSSRRGVLVASLAGAAVGVTRPAAGASGAGAGTGSGAGSGTGASGTASYGVTVDRFATELGALRLTATALPHAVTGAADAIDLSGALVVAPYGGLNWYFANLGLGFAAPHLSLSRLRTLVLPHLEAYLRNLTADLTALDLDFPGFTGPVQPTSWVRPTRDRDSDDSYAATALTVAARALRRLLAAPAHRPAALAWWAAHGPALLALARANLVDQVKGNGLTSTFRRDLPVPSFVGSRAEASVGYLMDNAEVHRGLVDLVGLITTIDRITGTTQATTDLRRAADKIARGIAALFDTQSHVYRPSDADRPFAQTPAAQRTTFYPWVTAQVFPALMEVSSEQHRSGQAWAFVDAHSHRWSAWPNGSDPGRPDAYPWAPLALAAVRRSRAVRATHPREAARRARQARTLVDSVGLALVDRRGVVTVNELGAALATLAELPR